ncbi:MAG: tetratricopeptide repeat protein [Candidatus Omnitrophota bacterium]|nr:tetratricopeptide repeat protein [Candidatus Omnitrophota bacterium]
MISELYDPDIWLHLKTGEYIVQNKAVPHVDIYSAPNLGKTWIDHSSLAQVIYYWVFNSNGPDGLIIFSAVLMLGAFLLLFFCIYKDRFKICLSVTMLALAIFASKIRFNIRPENFSVLFFCAYLFILTKYKKNKLLFILPFIQLAWVNCHGFFILGPVLIALFIISEGLKIHKKLPWEWADCEPIDKNGYQNLSIIFFLSILVSLINPSGIKGALYPLKIISHTIIHPSIIHNHILELLPPWRLTYGLILAYYMLLAIADLSFFHTFRKINFAYLHSWIALLGLSFNINRNIIFFNCIACVASVDNFSRINYKQLFGKVFTDNFIFMLRYIALVTIILCSVIWNLRMLNDRYYIFDQNRLKSYLLGLSNNYPNKAVDFILKNKLPDNLFNTFNLGSYLIYHLYPQNHVFIDGRTELYNNEFFEDYYRILYADIATTGKLLKRYNINTILLSGNLWDLEELIGYLAQDKEWVLVYLNDDGLIFIRSMIHNKDLTEQLRIDLNKQDIKRADLKKIGLRRVNPTPYVRLAQIFFALGDDQKAEFQAKEALSILSSAADAYAVLGKIYLRKNNLDLAYRYLRLSSIYASDSIVTLSALSNYYLRIGENKSAERKHKEIIQLNPEYGQGHYLLGIYYENSGNLKEAIKYLRKATELAPYSTEYLNKFREVTAKMKNN